jgi:hypothetical protein
MRGKIKEGTRNAGYGNRNEESGNGKLDHTQEIRTLGFVPVLNEKMACPFTLNPSIFVPDCRKKFWSPQEKTV